MTYNVGDRIIIDYHRIDASYRIRYFPSRILAIDHDGSSYDIGAILIYIQGNGWRINQEHINSGYIPKNNRINNIQDYLGAPVFWFGKERFEGLVKRDD